MWITIGVIDGDDGRRQGTETALGLFNAGSATASLHPAWLDKGYQLFLIVPRTPESPENTLGAFAGGVSRDVDKNPSILDSMKRSLKK